MKLRLNSRTSSKEDSVSTYEKSTLVWPLPEQGVLKYHLGPNVYISRGSTPILCTDKTPVTTFLLT